MGELNYTVSGDIASFRTPSRVPIESLKFHFLPKQAAGTPSPENPIPIEGWTGLNGRRAGKNLYSYSESNIARGEIKTGSSTYVYRTIYHTGIPSGSYVITASIKDGESRPSADPAYVMFNVGYCKDGLCNAKGWVIMTNAERAFSLTVPSGAELVIIATSDNEWNMKRWLTAYNIQIETGNVGSSIEPYEGENIPITFPVAGTNKLDPSVILNNHGHFSLNNGIWSNVVTDERTYIQLAVQLWKSTGTYIKTLYVDYVKTTGRHVLTFTVDDPNGHYICLKHNGTKKDFILLFPWTFGLHQYTISLDVLSADPTTVGGVQLTNIQLEPGDTAHAYEPYSSDNTFYGGYIDPVRGKIVATYAMYGLAWKDWDFGANLGNNTRKTFSINYSPYYYPKFDGGAIKTTASRCNVTNYYYNNNSDDIPHYYINSTGRVLYAILPNDMDENTVVQISSVLAEPIEYDIDPVSVKAFLDYNNFWSDANDITEVTYPVTESKDILDARKLITAGSQPHIESVSGSIASFNTDLKAPVKELKAHFAPVQEGSGDPSPVNVRPIHGFVGLNIHDEGKNLIDKNALTGTDKVWWKGSITTGFPEHCITPLIPVKPGASYYLYRKSTNSTGQSGQGYVGYFGKGGRSEYIGQENWQDNGVGNPHVIPDNVYYIGITVGTNYKDTAYLQLNDLPHEYANYVDGSVIPIEFPATKNLFRCIESEVINSGWNKYIPNPIKQPGTYTISCTYDGNFGGTGAKGVAFSFTDLSYQRVGNVICGYEFGTGTSRKRTFTVTSEQAQAPYIGIWPNSNGLTYSDIVNSIQIEAGSYATGFEPYGTAWGGYIDLIRGKFVAEYYRGIVKSAAGKQGNFFYNVTSNIRMPAINDTNDGLLCDYFPNNPNTAETYDKQSITIYSNQIMRWIDEDHINSSLSDYNAFLQEHPFEVVYKLKYPIEYDLTPQQIKTLKGTNNIWSDANGNIEVKYWTH